MWTNKWIWQSGLAIVMIGFTLPGWASNIPDTCLAETIDPDTNLISNGDFQEGGTVGFSPSVGWTAGTIYPVLRSETISSDFENYYLEFTEPGASISTIPKSDSTYSTRYDLQFCAVIPAGGQIEVYVGGELKDIVPAVSGSTYEGQYKIASLLINPSGSQDEKKIEFVYAGSSGIGSALLDNVQLGASSSGGEDETTPTPTPVVPTVTPTPSGPSPTPTPTFPPGAITPTPTPGLTLDSVQLSANPPMLLVNADDFVSSVGFRKQVALDLHVIGSNGLPIDITQIDPDASVRFTVDTHGEAEGVGVIQQYEQENRNWKSMTDRRVDLSSVKRIYFYPLKPFEGTVRIIAEIEYKGWAYEKEDNRKIRGVVPIVMKVDDQSSVTNTTGSFNAVQNANLGRKPGDRGFRPDMRTNLYFRERLR